MVYCYSNNRSWIYIGITYFLCFLLFTPFGAFNPGVPAPAMYGLTVIDPFDDTSYYMVAKSFIADGDLDYHDEHLHPTALYHLNERGNPAQGAKIPVGSSLLWTPFIAAAHLTTQIVNLAFDSGLSEDGYSDIYLTFTAVGSSFYVFLSLLISAAVLKRFFPLPLVIFSVLTIFLSNSLIHYTYIRALMSHSAEVFTISVYVYCFIMLRNQRTHLNYCLFGFSTGIMAIARYDNIIFLLLPFWDFLFSLKINIRNKDLSGTRSLIGGYSLAAVAASSIISLQFFHFYIQSGSFIPQSLTTGPLSEVFRKPVSLYDALFSSTRNITWGKPVVLIGAVGSLLLFRKDKFYGLAFSSIILIGILWLFWRPHEYWWGMDYGIRHLIKLSLPLAFGYAAIIEYLQEKKVFFIAITASIFIIFWEYIKIIQTNVSVAVLSDTFLTDIIASTPKTILEKGWLFFLGVKGSYLHILNSYMSTLSRYNMKDIFYLIFIPIFTASLIFFAFLVYRYVSKFNPKKVKYSLLFCSSIALSILVYFGISYPVKTEEKIFDDFRDAGYLALEHGNLSMARMNLIKSGISANHEDRLTSAVLTELEKKIGLQEFILKPGIKEILIDSASTDRSPVVMAFAEKWLQIKKGYYDLGEPSNRGFLKNGWSFDEWRNVNGNVFSFVWAVGNSSRMVLYSEGGGGQYLLRLRAIAFPENQRLEILVNSKKAGKIALKRDWDTYSLNLDQGMLKNGENEIIFLFSETRSPSEIGARDNRLLSMAVDWISLFRIDS